MMQRNLDGRVEIIFPIEDEKLKTVLMKTIIKTCLKDNTKARELSSDMKYTVPDSGDKKKINAQDWLMNHTIKAGGSYSKTKL